MDTPSQPPRRKLKRVLKKVEKLNSSTQKLSQKKLKAAINTSLNSTNSLRSLKNNNYSLALRLENVKEELKVIKDEKNDLLEENFGLREKVNSLEQMLLEEVRLKKDRVEMDGIKRIIKSLNNHMSNFCLDLEQLAQICFPRTSSLESRRSSHTKQRSVSGDSGDCSIQTENRGESLSPASKSAAGQDTSVVVENSPVKLFEQQYASSINKMRSIERRVQMENELPRRIRRSLYCPEEDEDVNSGPAELEVDALSSEPVLEESGSPGDDAIIYGITDVEPPISLETSNQLDDQDLETVSTKKITSKSKRKKEKKVSRQPPNFGLSKDLHIANEFALNAAHLDLIDRNKSKTVVCPDPVETVDCDEEQTIHVTTDMELTMPVDTTVLTASNNQEQFETFRDSLCSVKPRRLTRVLPESSEDPTSSQSSDELVPDAVTMRKMKPGQFKFAVGRKDSEGCRKEIVSVPKARSKSKKRIAELIEQLPQEDPKSIFDFHEKTPKFSSDKEDADLSVYSLANESGTSPSIPLKRDKVTRRATYSVGGLSSRESDANYSEGMFSTTEYLAPVRNSPSNMPRNASRLSRSRSRRRTKNTKRASIVDDHLLSTAEDLEQEEDNVKTLIGGVTYSEPLKTSPPPINVPKKTARVSRSRSRRRTKLSMDADDVCPSDTSNVKQNGQEDCSVEKDAALLATLGTEVSLIEMETYSEPLKDSPPNMNVKSSRISRSRSRRVAKPLLDIDKDYMSGVDESNHRERECNFRNFESEDSIALSLVGGEIYMEPLKESPQNVAKKSSRIQRSRSRRRTKVLSDTVEENLLEAETVSCSRKESCNLTKQEKNSESPTDNSDETPIKLSKITRCRSQRRQRKANYPSDPDEAACHDENTQGISCTQHGIVDPTEAVLSSDTVFDSAKKVTENISKISRSRSHKRTDYTSTESELNGESVFPHENENLNQDRERVPSLLGEGITYSEPLKDSPAKSPKVCKRSRSQSARLARSTGRSRKSNKRSETDKSMSHTKKSPSEVELDGLDQDHSGLQTEISARLQGQSFAIDSNTGEQEDTDLQVPDSPAFQSESVPEGDKGEPQSGLNQEILSVTSGRGKKSHRSKRTRAIEADNNETDQETRETLLDDDELTSKSSLRREHQMTKGKKSRSKKIKNQEDFVSDERSNVCIDSKEPVENDNAVGNDKSKEKTTSTNHKSGHSELECQERSDNFMPEDESHGCERSRVSARCLPAGKIDVHQEKRSDNEKCRPLSPLSSSVKKSRKRKHLVQDDSSVNDCKASNSAGNGPSAKTSKQVEELSPSLLSESQVNDKLTKHQTVRKSTEGQKRPACHSPKPPGQRLSSPVTGYARPRNSSLSLASPPLDASLKEESRGFQPERQRRTKQVMSYAEPSINKKLRRGDPFTAAHGSIQIFKSPKLQGKKKSNRNVLVSLQNLPVTDSTIME